MRIFLFTIFLFRIFLFHISPFSIFPFSIFLFNVFLFNVFLFSISLSRGKPPAVRRVADVTNAQTPLTGDSPRKNPLNPFG
ncbi:MAG: hypothetical protein ACI4RD_00965 [Kiritimatiellia bacterium]